MSDISNLNLTCTNSKEKDYNDLTEHNGFETAPPLCSVFSKAQIALMFSFIQALLTSMLDGDSRDTI